MAEKTTTEKTPKTVPAALRKSQVSPSFLPSEIAHISEATFAKRQRKLTDVARAAILAYIADVPKTDEVLELEAAEAAAQAELDAQA
jgi:hypothetical protein